MRALQKYQKVLKLISIVSMTLYILLMVLSIKNMIDRNATIYFNCIPIIAIILQAIVFINGLKEDSDCSGSNNSMRILLVWISVFLFTVNYL